MTELLARSPLASLKAFVTRHVEVRELPGIAKMRVQALRTRGELSPCADSSRFPTTPNASLGIDPVVLWRAPDDWLVYSLTHDPRQLEASLLAASSTATLFVTDVSAASVVLELRGPRALDVLMRDCTLDLEGDAMKPGNCAQTALAQIGVLLHRPADDDVWRIFVERSVAMHLWEWLVDS